MLKPLVTQLYDEKTATQRFPLLSDFESPFELSRFNSIGMHTKVSIDKHKGNSSQQSLAIHINTEPYSGVSMRYFPRDWQGYRQLNLSIYNPQQASLAVTLRIHDIHHPSHNYKFNDRFNKRFDLQQGWNHLAIDLSEVKQAPQTRSMDISQIADISLFTIKALPQTLWLDSLYLK